MAENMPFFFIPSLIAAQMFTNAMIFERYSIPDDSDGEKRMMPREVDYILPFIMGSLSLMMPAAVSLNWHIEQSLALTQFFFIRQKLKWFDGLDMEAIRQKDLDLKLKMQNGQTM